MNEALVTGAEGIRLITEFEGSPRLSARLCEGNRWELGYGCTFWPDGRPVREGQTINYNQVEPLLVHALKTFEDDVRRLVTVPLSQYQFDGLVALCYNIGAEQFATSTVLRSTNTQRFEDAAAAFGLWHKATSVVDDKGHPWIGPDGQSCRYTRALRGLLRRHYAEACVFLGFDWTEACNLDAIALRAERVWEPVAIRWHDRVDWSQTTSFSTVLAVARKHPLPMLLGAGARIVAAPPPQPAPLPPPKPLPAPAALPKVTPIATPTVTPAPVGTRAKSPNTVVADDVPYKIDANAGLKPLEETERAKGYWYQQAGIGLIRLGTLGAFGTGVQGVSATLQKDPVLSNLALTGVVVGGMAATGYVVKVYGDWRRKRGEKAATQGMY